MSKLNLENIKSGITINLKESELQAFAEYVISETIERYKAEIDRNPEDTFYNIKEVCVIFSIDRSTVHRWGKQKYLVPLKLGGLVRFRKSDILEIIDKANHEKI